MKVSDVMFVIWFGVAGMWVQSLLEFSYPHVAMLYWVLMGLYWITELGGMYMEYQQ